MSLLDVFGSSNGISLARFRVPEILPDSGCDPKAGLLVRFSFGRLDFKNSARQRSERRALSDVGVEKYTRWYVELIELKDARVLFICGM
jgi:hypothetical protein